MTAIDTILTAIATNNVATATDAINAGKRDALRGAFRRTLGGDPKGMKADELRAALVQHVVDAQPAPEPEPAPEKKERKPRGSKYTVLLQRVMDEHADENGVAVVTASVLLEMGFAKSTVVYHADWHHSLPCGRAAGALGLVGRLSTKGDGENTVTIRRIA